MPLPLVSVIIITYRQADTVARAIESVLAQETDLPFEIVIGEDASGDGTRAVCLDYARRYPDIVRLLPEAPNKGLVDNYFDTLLACRGEFITDCAGDDVWTDPHKLTRLVGLLRANPSATVAASDWRIVDPSLPRGEALGSDNPDTIFNMSPVVRGADLLPRVLGHIDTLPYNLSAAMYRRAALMRVYDADPSAVRNTAFGCEDVPVMAALASVGDAVWTRVPSLDYIVDGGSVSNSTDHARQACFYLRSTHCSALLARHYGVSFAALRRFYAVKSRYCIAQAFLSGDPTLIPPIREMLAEWPWRPALSVMLRFWLMQSPLWTPTRKILKFLKS